jgi:hypothetical protein
MVLLIRIIRCHVVSRPAHLAVFAREERVQECAGIAGEFSEHVI